MHIAVCDDEKVCQDLLSDCIKNCIASLDDHADEFKIDLYSSGETLLKACEQGLCFDIIFLDIKLEGASGFDTAKSLRDAGNNAVIIFVTSLADYIFRSFEYKPFWFLIKPIDEEKFSHVFLKAINEIRNIKKGEYSFFTREYGLVSLDISQILYLEIVVRKIIVYTRTKQYTYYGKITAEEEKLCKYHFIRIHKGYLVNMAHIQRINNTNVVLKNGVALPLSEHRFKAVFDSYTSYLAR